MRVAPRRLDGWEPRTIIVPEYDAAGRLVRSLEYREPEWDEDQRGLMIAYERYAKDVGPHGYLMSEATSNEADPNNYDSPLRFVPDDPIIDWVEKTKLDAADAWRKAEGDDANMNGMIFPVRKVTG